MFKKSLLAISLAAAMQMAGAAELPNTPVGPFNFKDMPVQDALVEVLGQADIKVVGHDLPVVNVTANNVKGNLPEVLAALASTANLKYSFNNGIVDVNGPLKMPVIAVKPIDLPVAKPFPTASISPIPVKDTLTKNEKLIEPKKLPLPATKLETKKEASPVDVIKEVHAGVALANAKPVSEVAKEVKVAQVADPIQSAAKEIVSPTNKEIKPIASVNTSIQLRAGDGVRSALAEAAKNNGYTLNWDGEDLYVKYDAVFKGTTFEDSLNQLLSSIKLNGYINDNTNNGRVIYVVSK